MRQDKNMEPGFDSSEPGSGSITGRTATGGMAQPAFFEQPPSSTRADIAASTRAHLVDAGGFFAKPTIQWFRKTVALGRLAREGTADSKGGGRD
jgi:hypothetical protein